MGREFPNVEALIVALIDTTGLVAGVGSDLPQNLQYRLPYVLVVRSGGPDDGVSDFPLVDAEVYAARKANGRRLSEQIRQRLLRDLPGWPIDRIETVGAIQELPFGTRNVRRWTNTFRVTTRRITTS